MLFGSLRYVNSEHNAAAGILTRISKRVHISPVLVLPVSVIVSVNVTITPYYYSCLFVLTHPHLYPFPRVAADDFPPLIESRVPLEVSAF